MVKKTILSFCYSGSISAVPENVNDLLNLQMLPYRLHKTTSPETYVQALKAKQPDIVILDYAAAIALLKHTSPQEKKYLSSLSGKTAQGIYKIPLIDVLYIESSGKSTTIHTQKRRYRTEQTLKHLLEKFPNDLIRLHRKILLPKHSLSHIQKDTNGKFYVTIPSVSEKLWISRRQLPFIKSLLLDDEK